MSIGACCCGAVLLCRGLHGAFVLLHSAPKSVLDLALLPGTLAPVLVQAVLSTFPAPRPVAAGEFPIARPCGRSCAPEMLVQRGSDVFLTLPSLHRDFLRRRGVLCLAHFAVSPAVGVSRAAQTFCHLRDAWLVRLLSPRNVLLAGNLRLIHLSNARAVVMVLSLSGFSDIFSIIWSSSSLMVIPGKRS